MLCPAHAPEPRTLQTAGARRAREIRMIKRCQNEECGKSFTPARRDAKFCSDRCRGQANARRVREAAAQ